METTAKWMRSSTDSKSRRNAITAAGVIVFVFLCYQIFFPILFVGRPVDTGLETFGETPEQLAEDLTHGPYAHYHKSPSWPGWAGVETMFIFGDSWTTTGFEIDQPQPNHTNPLGNPIFPGAAATNGANWVGHLVGTHNQSFIATVNLAYGGATVDEELIHPFDAVPPGMRSFKYQIHELFLPNYGASAPLYEWLPETTLFAIWMGLNDLHNANEKSAQSFGLVFERFADYVDKLYLAGGRNFLFLNIPPIDRSPLGPKMDMVQTWHDWTIAWNHNITLLAANLTEVYPDATTIIFDAWKFYGDEMDDPTLYPESAGFLVTDEFCPMYAFGASAPDEHREGCEYSIDKYFWMNDIHPTSPMFNATAHAIAEALT